MKGSRVLNLLIALLFGGVGVFAYSPFDQAWVSLLSATALLYLATHHERRTALLGVFVWAVSYFAVGVHWVHVSMIQFGGVPLLVSYLAVLLLAAYLALYPLLFTYLTHRFRLQTPWAFAAVWTLTEYLRGVVFTGFPWLQFGYSLIDSPFAGLAPLLGVEGLTFFVMVISGYLCCLGRQFTAKTTNVTACLPLILLILLGYASSAFRWVSPDAEAKPTTISLIQANIAQRMKWDPAHFDNTLRRYADLISPLLGKSELIILPESAIPATEQHIAPLLTQLDRQAATQGSQLILGTLYQNAHDLFNSAVVLGRPSQPYHIDQAPRFNKHHLVPFGEYVPFGELLDWMRDIFILPTNLSQGDFIQPPLTAAQRRFSLAICYEIIFGHQLQQNQQAHPSDYLLTLSNDAWFGESIGPWQHMQMARMRALELGKPLIRATNTGITAFVDGEGNIIQQAPQFEATHLTHQLTPYQGRTPFSQFGRNSLFALCLLVMLLHGWRRR